MGATPRAPPVSKDQVAATIAAGTPGPDPRTPRAIGASEDAAEDPLTSQQPADASLPGSQTSRDEAVAESASAQSAGLPPPPASKPADRTDSNAGSTELASSASLMSAPSALLGNARNAAVDDTAASSSQLLMGLGTIDAPAESAAPELLAGEPLPPTDEATDVPLAPPDAISAAAPLQPSSSAAPPAQPAPSVARALNLTEPFDDAPPAPAALPNVAALPPWDPSAVRSRNAQPPTMHTPRDTPRDWGGRGAAVPGDAGQLSAHDRHLVSGFVLDFDGQLVDVRPSLPLRPCPRVPTSRPEPYRCRRARRIGRRCGRWRRQ
jgi:hypothetical protein